MLISFALWVKDLLSVRRNCIFFFFKFFIFVCAVSRECSPEGSPPPAPPPVPNLPAPVMLPHKVTVATQTGHETPDLTFDAEKLTTDPHCYECKVRYRDPKPRDLVMYLHAFKYQVIFISPRSYKIN